MDELHSWRDVAAEAGDNLLSLLHLAAMQEKVTASDLLKLATIFKTLVEVLGDVKTAQDAQRIFVVFDKQLEEWSR